MTWHSIYKLYNTARSHTYRAENRSDKSTHLNYGTKHSQCKYDIIVTLRLLHYLFPSHTAEYPFYSQIWRKSRWILIDSIFWKEFYLLVSVSQFYMHFSLIQTKVDMDSLTSASEIAFISGYSRHVLEKECHFSSIFDRWVLSLKLTLALISRACFIFNHLSFAKMEEIIKLDASKMRRQGSILDYLLPCCKQVNNYYFYGAPLSKSII